MPKRKVLILNSDKATDDMFKQSQDWTITKRPDEADLIQFTGSGDSDVPPDLYGEDVHRKTTPDISRAKREAAFYQVALRANIPMAGICYGAQFLNVMNGGWLWQDVNGHQKPHYITDELTGESYLVSSSHHQQMRLKANAIILATAGESTFRDFVKAGGRECTLMVDPKRYSDPEVVLYSDTRCLCVQYHPEWQGWSSLASRYMDEINHHLFFTK